MFKKAVSVGEARVMFGVWGPDEVPSGLSNWDVDLVKAQRDVHYGTLQQKCAVLAFCKALRDVDVHRAFAPTTRYANATIVDTNTLKAIQIDENGRTIHRNHNALGDGAFLKKNEAFMFAGRSPVIVASGGGYLIAASAGKNSLIDRDAVIGKPSRWPMSIVGAIANEFSSRAVPLEEVSLSAHFAIPAGLYKFRLDGEEYQAPHNEALLQLLQERWPAAAHENGNRTFILDLEELICAQAREAGIKDVSAANNLSEFPTLAHPRDGKDRDARNLIIVRRM